MPPRQRSRRSNSLDASFDARTAQGRRFRDVCSALVSELGRPCSDLDFVLIRRASELVTLSETLRAMALRCAGSVPARDLVRLEQQVDAAMRRVIGASGQPRLV
jgi:hypothetical protein